MASSEVDSPPVVSTKRLEGSLVAPPSPLPVPNHLTARKMFSTGGASGVVQTNPSVLHFSGYCVGNIHKLTLRVINASKDNQHMHIIPPATPYFTINYTKKKSRLVPGLSLDITVEFRPTEWKYYYDCIRIHCKGDQNLLVPIHAYPVMSTAKFPSHVRFPATPVGRTRNKTLSLECDIPVDFEFQLTIVQHHPAFVVTPMRGIVPASGKVDVMVTFAPTEFNTAVMKLQLELTQFNFSPLLCTFSGSSLPGLDIEPVIRHTTKKTIPPAAKLTRTHALPPLTDSKSSVVIKKSTAKEKKEKKKIKTTSSNSLAAKDGERMRMDCPAAVSKLLTQKSSRQQDILQSGGLGLTSSDGGREEREAKFLRRVDRLVKEERANRLRWVTQLGSDPPTSSEIDAILKERNEATELYLYNYCHKPVAGSELSHTHTQCFYRRTRCPVNEHPTVSPTFDHYSNNVWQKRQRTRMAFIRAARKIMIQVRVKKRLEKIGEMVRRIKSGLEAVDDQRKKTGSDDDIMSHISLPVCDILPLSFPKSHPNFTNSTQSQQPTAFPVKPTEVPVQNNFPIMELKVPCEYQLLGYTSMPCPVLETYIPPGPPRPLKTGAQAELENLGHIPGVSPAYLTPSHHHTLTPSHSPTTTDHYPPPSMTLQDIEITETEYGATEADSTILSLVPPPFRTEPCSLQHILNPCPGILHYYPPLPHSEDTLDHTFLPLPLHPPSSSHTHPPLHPQDYIPGLMRWKPFPSLWLVANEKRDSSRDPHPNNPRTRDDFLESLIEEESEPQLLSGPLPNDLVDDHDSSEVLETPTPEMVQSLFSSPLEHTKDNRASRKSKETSQKTVTKPTDRLGTRIQQRLDQSMALLLHETANNGKT